MEPAGIQTRSQKRQRSQSKEPQAVPTTNGNKGMKEARANGNSLDAVTEEPSRPISVAPTASQKSVRTESSMSINMNDSLSQISNGRPLSPLSLSRAQEKTELQNLNDRLAVILRTLSDSQEENQELKIQLKTVAEEANRNLIDELEQYKRELEKARVALDAESNEKTVQVLAREKIQLELHDYQKQLAKDNKRLEDTEARAKAAEKHSRDLKQKLDQINSDVRELDSNNMVLKNDLEDARKQLREAQLELEREVMERTATENKMRTALEKAQFEASITDQRIQRQSISAVDSVGRRSRSQLDVADYMQMFRQDVEDAKNEIEEQLENKYAKQLSSLETLLNSQRENIEILEASQDAFRKDHKEDQRTIAALQKKNRELEDDIDRQRKKFDALTEHNLDRTASLNDQNIELHKKYQDLLTQYQKLQSANVELSQELFTYNNLLSSEEERLGITSPERCQFPNGRPLKRKRVETPTTPKSKVVRSTVKTTANKSKASGAVRILEVNPGKFVRIENTGDSVVSLGNWHLKQHSGTEEIVYDFQPEHHINGHSIISIYSSTENEVPHDGITEIVWTQSWAGTNSGKTILTNADEMEVASYESITESTGSESPGVTENRSVGFLGRIFGRS